MIRHAIPIILAAALAGPAAADFHTFDGCDLEPEDYDDLVLPILDGDWQVQAGSGLMLVSGPRGQGTLPVEPEAPQGATFYYDGGDVRVGLESLGFYVVTLVSAETLGDYGLPDPAFEGAQDMMDFGAIGEAAPNCSTDLLPIVTYGGELPTGGGNFEAILHVITADLMSGILIVNVTEGADQAHIRRFLTMRR